MNLDVTNGNRSHCFTQITKKISKNQSYTTSHDFTEGSNQKVENFNLFYSYSNDTGGSEFSSWLEKTHYELDSSSSTTNPSERKVRN